MHINPPRHLSWTSSLTTSSTPFFRSMSQSWVFVKIINVFWLLAVSCDHKQSLLVSRTPWMPVKLIDCPDESYCPSTTQHSLSHLSFPHLKFTNNKKPLIARFQFEFVEQENNPMFLHWPECDLSSAGNSQDNTMRWLRMHEASC
jgi:hypothetical protein